MLSWGRSDGDDVPAEAMSALLDAGRRGSDLVVVDLPRHLVDSSRVALERADLTLLVVPAELRAAAAATRVVAAVRDHCPDVRLLVRGPAPSGLDATVMADALGLPLAGNIRQEQGIAAALERGDPPASRPRGPLATFCAGFLREVVAADRRVA